MGLIVVFETNSLINALGVEGSLWLTYGGISYVIGALFYSIPKIKYNHAIFHVFVLLGSFAHFILLLRIDYLTTWRNSFKRSFTKYKLV